ncbi:hypothetical protein [Spirosoma endophyticum]|uniref:Uncharacterized protein n=1 Tax=Spirosoma endophyticum TaxID=662367 RepID=A0A1I2BXN2_9BACT|nr:hypothetical protein [Spirosoma endophyticum]SFE60889.1 hypothetical protein SAMN05216167_11641 [Spirosoma endophyticum]
MANINKTILQSLGSGLAGACALNILHETVRHFVDEAPRVDIVGERAIKKMVKKVGQEPPTGDALYTWTLGSDIVSNALYYSLVGLAKPKHAVLAGGALGLAAGVGAVGLPGPMGLGTAPTKRTPATAAMTIGWYLVGGLVTAGVYTWLKRR